MPVVVSENGGGVRWGGAVGRLGPHDHGESHEVVGRAVQVESDGSVTEVAREDALDVVE